MDLSSVSLNSTSFCFEAEQWILESLFFTCPETFPSCLPPFMPIKGNQRQLGARSLPPLNGSVFSMPLSCTCRDPAPLPAATEVLRGWIGFHCLHFWSEADWEKWVLSKRGGSRARVSIPARHHLCRQHSTVGMGFCTASCGVFHVPAAEEGCEAKQGVESLIFMRLFILSVTSVWCLTDVEWEFNAVIK